jgi:outer membrane protein assembly factor BamB
MTGGGNSERNGLSDEIGPAEPDHLWQAASSAWFGNQMFTEGDKLVTRRYIAPYNVPIVCYDFNTGVLLWSVNLPGAFQSLPLGCRDGKVYALNYHESGVDTLCALDVNDGSIIWQVLVPELPYFYSPESAAFTSNGDLILGDLYSVNRYDKNTGQLLWSFNRVGFASGCSEALVYENTVYAWTQSGGAFQIVAIDADNGMERYRVDIEGTPGGPMQQAAPGCVGSDGRIYVHRQGDNITALEDTGVSLQVLWSVPISGSAPFGYIAVGQDGSVYAPIDGAVIRIDPSNGTILNTSETISTDLNTKTRFAVGQNGTIYVSDGEFDAGELWAFSPDLTTLWNEPVHDINDSGPALGQDGKLAVAGDQYITVFKTVPPVSITLTPYGSPIVIPAAGGSFDFNVELTNNELYSTTFDTWISTQLPNGSWYGPLLGPVNITLSGGFSINRDRTQYVPGNAPAGTYTYAGYVGVYPDDIWASDSFSFEKSTLGDNGLISDWLNYGEYFEEYTTELEQVVPDGFVLNGAYPNPFNPVTTISFSLLESSLVTLEVFDTSGRRVGVGLAPTRQYSPGKHEIAFDGSNLPSGVYFYRLEAGNVNATGNMVLMK